MKWLCDTNVISEMFTRTPNQQVHDWLTRQDEILPQQTLKKTDKGVAG